MINNNKIYKIAFFLLLPLIITPFFLAFSCKLYGQVTPKKDLKPCDYQLWGRVRLDKISLDEKWASYNMFYENGKDTLFVKNIQNQSTYFFAGGVKGTFTNNNFFICQIKDGIIIQNLKTGKNEIVSGIKSFAYSNETDQIIALRSSEQSTTLMIRSLEKDDKKEISNVNQFSLSPKGHHLLYQAQTNNKKVLSILNLKKANETKPLVADSAGNFDDFTWQKDGGAIAFTSEATPNHSLFYYIVATGKLYRLNPSSNSTISNEMLNTSGSVKPVIISDDLQKVFFSVQKANNFSKNKSKPEVEIWNANDGFTFKRQKNIDDFNLNPTVGMWRPHVDQISRITSTELPDLMITGNFEHVILSNPKTYEPQFEANAPRDFYVMDLKTLEKHLFLKNLPYDPRYPTTSPNGKYFVYFKGKDWWVYNISMKTHVNVTSHTGSSFIGKTDELVPESAYGNPGWTMDDKEIVLYDQYDLWTITPDGKTSRRLTKGRESGIKYRVARKPNKIGENVIFSGLVVDSFDLSRDLFLRAQGDDEKTGYFRWNAKTGEQPITYGDIYVDGLNYNGAKKKIFYTEQRFDLSPRLMSADNSSVPIPFLQSNLQQQSYHWGKSELISYYNSKGVRLKGTLFYPANYDASKKYPMIVHIYELQSNALHKYQNPSSNGGTLNISLFTSQGYFVLLPDIQLLKGNPGISAADCTIAATKSVIEKGLVDPSKIGLMGHSFGGYETAFIITQTNLFATAIASGGITNLISFYHTINVATGQPDMWRFLNGEWNMGGTPYDIPELYNANSPIAHVQNIQTPVLLWTGKNDTHVDYHQTMELYLALRRLGKKAIMLQYPNEGHGLIDTDYKKDLTNRMRDWFDYFLKDQKTADWIANGIGK